MSRETFDRSVRWLAGPPAPPGARLELIETGIKVIDVMCPLVRGGTVAIAGELRAGTTVVLEELVRRLSGGSDRVSFFTLAPWLPQSIADTLKKDGFSEGTVGAVQTFYFRTEEGAWIPERLASLSGVNVVIRLSADLAGRGIYPTVDPLTSRSRLIEVGNADADHIALAARITEALRSLLTAPEGTSPTLDARARGRAEKLLRFFAQPFFVAEPYTHRPGMAVSLAESLRVCREILDGVHDVVPTDAFYFTGGLDDVLTRG